MRLAYIAYPTSLLLRSANAIQTHTTLRELRRIAPDTLALIPRWLGEPSRFTALGAHHLLRPAIGKLSRLRRSTLWYYAERSLFAAMTAAVVAQERRRGSPVDVVYIREVIGAAWWAGVWGPLLGIPVIYEAHDLESWNPSRAKERVAQPLLHLVDRVALTRSAAVASLTEDFRRLLARIGWRNPAEVAVIPDAFDDEAITPGSRAAARRELGISEAAPLIVYAGMTFSYRSLDKLLIALAALREQLPGATLALVGGRDAEVATLQRQQADLLLDDAIIWAGQQPQDVVAAYLRAADVLIIPDTVTDVTASPLKLFEYLAAGRAVALPDIPALEEILPPAVGYYFRRGDSTAMAEALAEALTDPARPEREAAGRAAVADHTYARRAERIVALAQQVAQAAK
ncbi:glycosyltransferase family 4 protein [Chloroflexia bacterium SDU3-3]|nr:glycosyltransferase family 4 protein [Chloroflexia bacterium SDU3-3]